VDESPFNDGMMRSGWADRSPFSEKNPTVTPHFYFTNLINAYVRFIYQKEKKV